MDLAYTPQDMARVRKIKRHPRPGRNYFVVDACFLANKYIPYNVVPAGIESQRIQLCKDWWREIVEQLKRDKARIYVPDICIAEAFKVLAKKYYGPGRWFKSARELNNARERMRKDIRLSSKMLRAQKRAIRFHDIPTCRDIIIAVDRFYELFLKHGNNVSLPDLIIVASAKYLMDFYDIPRASLHIVTMDGILRRGIRKIAELPNAYDPTSQADASLRIFE